MQASQSRLSFLILGNLRGHHSRPAKAWLVKHEDAIEVFYLPSYSPELNPDEMANAGIKQAVTKQAPARTKLQLVKAAPGICVGSKNNLSVSVVTFNIPPFAMPPNPSL